MAGAFTIALGASLRPPVRAGSGALPSGAAPLTRSETIAIARSFAEHAWEASASNVRHGRDARGITVQTPDAAGDDDDPGKWRVGANVGVPYKWGGFDSLASFDAGIRASKAAGDLYSIAKRIKGGGAVSAQAVGIDCSGFISRCWRLPRKYGTATLPELCLPLGSVRDLRAGDIMNQPGGHVLLFGKWLDDSKARALFYEAEPFSKVLASEHDVSLLYLRGARPLRYRQMRE